MSIYLASQPDFSTLGTSSGGNEGTMISLGTGYAGLAGPVSTYIKAVGNTDVVFALYQSSFQQTVYNSSFLCFNRSTRKF